MEHGLFKHFCVDYSPNMVLLRILLEDYTSSFDELLEKIDDTRVHVKNLRNLMVAR